MEIYVTKKGDTVYSVAAEYGVSPERLAFDNDVAAPARLPVGMPLAVVIPLVTHTVREGETLYGIAREYGVSVETLWRNNIYLSGGDSIREGEVIYIETERDPLGSFFTGGYVYPNVNKALLSATLPFSLSATPFTYGFTRGGELVPLEDDAIIALCEKYSAAAVMHLSTLDESGNFSVESASALLGDEPAQRRLINAAAENIAAKGYRALDIDFEFLGSALAAPYAGFVSLCRDTLSPLGIPVITALAPKTSDTQPGALYEGHDYALLGEAADALLLMTYEWGYTYGPPMAVSPITPVSRVVDYALTRIPAKKLLLGISNYGYDFTLPYIQGVSKAESLSVRAAFALASETGAEIMYDPVSMAPYFEYSSYGAEHRVWFEDVRSISARLRLMAEKGLSGALWWNFDRANNQNLAAINDLILPRRA